MLRRETLLRLFLRGIGSLALLALPCALMPYAWMDAVHRWLDPGELPSEPIVGYLASSSTRVLYCLHAVSLSQLIPN